MNFDVIVDFITRVGFPIAMCVMCLWYINKSNTEHVKERESTTTAITNMANAVENNTAVTTQLVNVLSQWMPVIIQTRNNPNSEHERSDTYE